MTEEERFHFVGNQLSIERVVNSKKERFTAKFDLKKGISLEGTLGNYLEVGEFVRFISFLFHIQCDIKEPESKSEADQDRPCACETKEKRLISQEGWFAVWGPLAGYGEAFRILECKSCGRLSKEVTETIMS